MNRSERDRLAAETEGVTLTYGSTTALKDVSLRVPRGVMGAIVGPNGAGKSTLLKVLLGLTDGHEGEARLLGQPSERSRHLVGYVPQRATVDWDFPANVLDVVMMGLYRRLGPLRRVGKAERERARRALAEVGMQRYEERHIGQLTGGPQQRVFLARALVQEAELYLLDEPFAGVDATSEATLVEVLRRLNAAGATILAVHHDLHTLATYFDWLALLNVELYGQGPLATTLTPELLEATYGGTIPILAGRRDGDGAERPPNGPRDGGVKPHVA